MDEGRAAVELDILAKDEKVENFFKKMLDKKGAK